MRTYTLREAADLTGLSQKALRSRVDRGALRATLVDGLRRIPASELVRAGLLEAADEAGRSAPRGDLRHEASQGSPGAAPRGTAQVVVDVNALVARVEELTADLIRHRLLAEQAESRITAETHAREALEQELHQVRAALQTAEARLAEVVVVPTTSPPAAPPERSSWWRRLFASAPAAASPMAPKSEAG